jgi:hypothetical protein
MKEANRDAKSHVQQLKAGYFAEVEKEYERMKSDLMDRLKDWPIPEQGLIMECDELTQRLTGSNTEGLSHEDKHLRNAWEDISRGMRYIGGPRTLELGYRAGIAPMPPKQGPVRLQVDHALRKVHLRAEAAHKYLQWLRDQQVQPEPSTPQECKDCTGAENGLILTQRQAAYLLAYRNEGLQDPRSDSYRRANILALEMCQLSSPTSGQQLYVKFDRLRKASDRSAAFNTEVEKYKEAETKSPKAMKAVLRDIETIIPRLEGKEKAEAETDLTNWKTMYLDAIA